MQLLKRENDKTICAVDIKIVKQTSITNSPFINCRMNLAINTRGDGRRLSLPHLADQSDSPFYGNNILLQDFLCFLARKNMENQSLSSPPPSHQRSQAKPRNSAQLLSWLDLPYNVLALLQNWVQKNFPEILTNTSTSLLELIALVIELLADKDQTGRLKELRLLQNESSTYETCILCQPPRQFVLQSSLNLHTILHHNKNRVELSPSSVWYSTVEQMQTTTLDIWENGDFMFSQKSDRSAAEEDIWAPTKRGRTKLTNSQLNILRNNFNLNNSPSESTIGAICRQTELKEKVVKHWFRNTLFKERQRNKDSPYNFSTPPTTSLNLEKYEKTGKVEVWPTDLQNMVKNKPEEEEEVVTEEEMCSGDAKGYTGSLSDISKGRVASPVTPLLFSADNSAKKQQKQQQQNQPKTIGSKRIRTAISQSQQVALSRFFQTDPNPSRRQMDAIACTVSLPKRVVQVSYPFL